MQIQVLYKERHSGKTKGIIDWVFQNDGHNAIMIPHNAYRGQIESLVFDYSEENELDLEYHQARSEFRRDGKPILSIVSESGATERMRAMVVGRVGIDDLWQFKHPKDMIKLALERSTDNIACTMSKSTFDFVDSLT